MKTTLFLLVLLIGSANAGNLHRLKSKQLGPKSGTLYYDQKYLQALPAGLNFLDTPLYQCIVIKPSGLNVAVSKIKFVSCKIKPDAQKRIDGSRTNKRLNILSNILEV